MIDYSRHTILVTGASAGIGASIAEALAARGADLALVARRMDRLDALGARLRQRHGVRVETVAADLASPRPGPAIRAELAARGIRVTGIVSNAGFGTDGRFDREDPDRLAAEIAVDAGAVVDLAHTFLPDVRAAAEGILVTITSEAAYQPIPGMAVYSAAKAFALTFTEALWGELRGTGVRVLAFAPGLTATEFFDELGTEQYGGRMQTPQQVADALLRELDRRDPGPSAMARPVNGMLGVLSAFVTRRARVLVTARIARSSALMAARANA
ncbi:SDR family NAD(P)-dependent oxidoreductase [Agrococcus sp. SGAir0287]|uniref:SDR family NAD(P)-dependent oxidoreductase n=1 Tax=Agrococcus sp. SGAir0287 TaxID=2070347 RepID=UPI0010CCC4DD|nr:SDR family NAD(P)-dependent oxidoreductase [Agrococcus sp. SGAir0287]QCR19704.1 oxidoreductase [Agrococcus sp. SGAir0287]